MLSLTEVHDALNSLADHTIEANIPMRFMEGMLRRKVLENALALEGGNQVHAARRLGIHRNSLRLNLKKLGVKK
jgi:DNA-binding NtrC family response regulator